LTWLFSASFARITYSCARGLSGALLRLRAAACHRRAIAHIFSLLPHAFTAPLHCAAHHLSLPPPLSAGAAPHALAHIRLRCFLGIALSAFCAWRAHHLIEK